MSGAAAPEPPELPFHRSLRLYDERVSQLVDYYMEWTPHFRSDEEVDARRSIVDARFGEGEECFISFRKDKMGIERLRIFSNMIVAHLLDKVVRVDFIDFKLYAPRPHYRLRIATLTPQGAQRTQAELDERRSVVQQAVVRFLEDSELWRHVDRQSKRPTREAFQGEVEIVRRCALWNVDFMERKQRGLNIVGHSFLVMWEIQKDQRGPSPVAFYVIDNLKSESYTEMNLEMHKVIEETLRSEFLMPPTDPGASFRFLVMHNALPKLKVKVRSSGFAYHFSCMTKARRAALYLAILPGFMKIGIPGLLEEKFPYWWLFRPRKMQDCNPCQRRLAHNVMLYAQCMVRIMNFLFDTPLLWTDRTLTARRAARLRSRRVPCPIYVVDHLGQYRMLNVREFLQMYPGEPLFFHITGSNLFLGLHREDPSDERRFYFDLLSPAGMVESPPVVPPEQRCTVSSGALVRALVRLHRRIVELEAQMLC